LAYDQRSDVLKLDCGATLAAGTKCTIDITFTPAALGARSAALSVVDDACMSPQTIALSGKGTEITIALYDCVAEEEGFKPPVRFEEPSTIAASLKFPKPLTKD
jgi:hypothetical protein